MKEQGTALHKLAADCIHLQQPLPKTKKTLNMYVNDAIGYRMQPEQILYFSENCYGTADAISFRRNTLRIHDLKTGLTEARMEQLRIYAALFCLEYDADPEKLTDIVLRIYQSNEIEEEHPSPDEIVGIMNHIIHLDRELMLVKEGL